MGDCKHATYKNNVLEQYLYCNKVNSPCAYQRYCNPEGRVIHTETVNLCPSVLMDEGEQNV